MIENLLTVKTKVSEAEDSGAVRDDCDLHILGRMLLKDIVDATFVLQTKVETFGVDINV
jgi:hypothetical protein